MTLPHLIGGVFYAIEYTSWGTNWSTST